MNDGNKEKFGRFIKEKGKRSGLLLSVVLLLSLTIGGTLAYIAISTTKVDNQFMPVQVSCEVVGENNTFSVKNTSDVDAYVRASITVNWVVVSGNNIRGIAPIEETDYSLSVNYTEDSGSSSTTWYKDNDYYYFKEDLGPEEIAEELLIRDFSVVKENVPDGYELMVEVVAEAIQADGTDSDGISPLQLHWGENAAKWVGIYKESNN